MPVLDTMATAKLEYSQKFILLCKEKLDSLSNSSFLPKRRKPETQFFMLHFFPHNNHFETQLLYCESDYGMLSHGQAEN